MTVEGICATISGARIFTACWYKWPILPRLTILFVYRLADDFLQHTLHDCLRFRCKICPRLVRRESTESSLNFSDTFADIAIAGSLRQEKSHVLVVWTGDLSAGVKSIDDQHTVIAQSAVRTRYKSFLEFPERQFLDFSSWRRRRILAILATVIRHSIQGNTFTDQFYMDLGLAFPDLTLH